LRRKSQYQKYIDYLNAAHGIITKGMPLSLDMCDRNTKAWKLTIDVQGDINEELSRERKLMFGMIALHDSYKNQIEIFLGKLNDFPDFSPKAHQKIISLFGVYSQIVSLCSSPTGSYITYNSQISDLESEFTRVNNELKVVMPNISQ